MHTFWEYLHRYPPLVVRCLARTGGRNPRVLSNHAIAQSAGMDQAYVAAISERLSWDGIPVDHLRRFCAACHVDFGDPACMKAINHYYAVDRPGKWRYLRRAPDWETFYAPLLRRLAQSLSHA